MTAPVPFEARVRPLIAAASKAPWVADAPNGLITDANIDIVVDDASLDRDNAALTVTAVNTAAACADLAEAVRRVVRDGLKREGSVRDYFQVDESVFLDLRAALSRLDAAGGA